MAGGPLSLQPDYGQGDVALPREGKDPRVAFDAGNPVDLLEQLIALLDKEQLAAAKRAAENIRGVVSTSWEDRSTVVTWDWKPAARHIKQWIEDVLRESPTNVWMSKHPGRPIALNFQMDFRSHYSDKWNQGKFNTLRKQLGRKFDLTPSSMAEDAYTLPDGQRVEVQIFVGGTPSGDRLGSLGEQPGETEKSSTDRVAERFRQALVVRSQVKEAAMPDVNPFDGQRKQKVLNVLNHLMDPFTKGHFSDQYWTPIQNIRKVFERENVPAELLKAEYKTENGLPTSKVWVYEVPFLNQNGREDKVFVHITASGAGPVDEPLKVYDVTAYAT